jgi:MFS family permease
MAHLTSTGNKPIDWDGWWKFTLVSLTSFHITAATFASLGVALPFMIEEHSWSWSNAGMGFSVLAFMVGITGRLPGWSMQRFGTGVTFGIGGLIMAIGFTLLAMSAGLSEYFAGAALAGLGYTLCATVPGVAVINHALPHRRSFAIGAYMTIGGLGAVLGPLSVTQVVELTGSWRTHWWLMAAINVVLVVLAVLTFRRSKDVRGQEKQATKSVAEKPASGINVPIREWTLRDVLRTPQYFVIVAAWTMTLFGGVTTNSWAVTHMGTLGISITLAAGALSAHALINAFSRAFGGMLSTWIDPKWLLVSALAAEIMGMIALASADNMLTITLFVFGEGYGFGMCLFATTILLVNYYGPKEAPKTMGTMHTITTLAMVGPVLGGIVADKFGGFAGLFRVYALVLFLCLIAAALMKPPSLPKEKVSSA